MDLTSAQKAPKTKEGRRVSYNNHFVVKRTKKKKSYDKDWDSKTLNVSVCYTPRHDAAATDSARL